MKFDFHSHILPGVDDGSRSLEESIEMLKLQASQGIDHVVATPHFYANCDTPERFLKRRQDAFERVQEEMEKHSGLPRVSLGAEVYYFRGISESDGLLDLTFGNKRFILLEMPEMPWTQRMLEEIRQIYVKQGIVPVIAHIDRYISPFRTYGIFKKLRDMPVLVQANAGFFLRAATRSMALRMLRRDQIQLLGSDCHNLTSRVPNLGPACQIIEDRLGPEVLERMDQCGADVLSDESNMIC